MSYRDEVIALIESTRAQLAKLYAIDITDAEKRDRKAQTFDAARAAHAEIADRHKIQEGFTRWFSDELNNAKMGSVSAYNSLRPAFVNMIRAQDLDFSAFFEYVAVLGSLEKSARENCLQAWARQTAELESDCPG